MANQNTARKAQTQNIQSIETVTIPLELAHRLNNAAYFYHIALGHIVKTFIPSVAAAVNSGEIRLIGYQLETMKDFIEQYTEQYQGCFASSDYTELDGEGLLPRGHSEQMATSSVYTQAE